MPIAISGSGPITGVTSLNTTVSDTELGYLDGVTSALQTQINAKLNLAGGKILQIVRATDGTNRSTTSSSYVDASISVTITPQKSDSAIFLIWSLSADNEASTRQLSLRITDSSNNSVSGAEGVLFLGSASRIVSGQILMGWSTPATTSATTYKGRFASLTSNQVSIRNSDATGQLYAIEVSA